jgi:hypothetical protein
VEAPFRIPRASIERIISCGTTKHWLKHTFISRTAEGEPRLAHKDVNPSPYTPMERQD